MLQVLYKKINELFETYLSRIMHGNCAAIVLNACPLSRQVVTALVQLVIARETGSNPVGPSTSRYMFRTQHAYARISVYVYVCVCVHRRYYRMRANVNSRLVNRVAFTVD